MKVKGMPLDGFEVRRELAAHVIDFMEDLDDGYAEEIFTMLSEMCGVTGQKLPDREQQEKNVAAMIVHQVGGLIINFAKENADVSPMPFIVGGRFILEAECDLISRLGLHPAHDYQPFFFQLAQDLLVFYANPKETAWGHIERQGDDVFALVTPGAFDQPRWEEVLKDGKWEVS